MKIEPREKTKAVWLQVSEISDPLFIADASGREIWVSTAFGDVRVGVVGGKTYCLVDGALIPEEKCP